MTDFGIEGCEGNRCERASFAAWKVDTVGYYCEKSPKLYALVLNPLYMHTRV